MELDDPASLFERGAGIPGMEPRRLAVPQVAQEVGLPAPVGEELGVELRVVEARHRAAVQPEGTGGDDEIAALDAAIPESRDVCELGVRDEDRAEVPLRIQAREQVVEERVVG